MALGVDTASNRNKYQKYLQGGKGSRCIGADTRTNFMCRLSENLGTVRASPGLYEDSFTFTFVYTELTMKV
jgi:hypothetical protein